MKYAQNVKPYEKVWAILSRDKDGNEGICLMQGPFGPTLAVTGEEKNLIYLKSVATSMEARTEVHSAGMNLVVGEFQRVGTEKL